MPAKTAQEPCLPKVTGPVVPVVFATNDNYAPYPVSLRIGLFITWLPRKVMGGIRCVRDHGLGYTLRRCLYHLGLREDEEDTLEIYKKG